jgi:hypothetical protein
MSYEAVAKLQDGGWWYVRVPALGRTTQAKSARQVRGMAADLVTAMTDEEAPDVAVRWEVAGLTGHLTASAKAREREAAARREAAEELRAAAAVLRAEGLPLADVGAVLGVSHQRAAQLLA